MEVNRDPLPQAGIGGNPEPQGSYVTYADREYVWGPDYVDECLWQVDRPGATAFVVQDANFNVVALVDPQGQLLRQYDYDPYGQPIAADNLGAFGHNRIGHQGLFADRFDADAPAADLAVGAELLYYARNRDYSPRLGRWVQRDPNGSGSDTLTWSVRPELRRFDLLAVYMDGLSLHVYTRSTPTGATDPYGLFSIGGTLGRLALGLQVGGKAYGAASVGFHTGQLVTGQISAQQYATSVLADAIMAGGFWGAGKGATWAIGWASGAGRSVAIAGAAGIPQGLNTIQFTKLSRLLRSRVSHIGDDLFVHGSRARGAASASSDLDIGIRVSANKFEDLVRTRQRTLQPGSRRYNDLERALETGKLPSGDVGLRSLRRELEGELSMDVHLSVIRAGSSFDQRPFIPIP
jgi:hypothetical protein